MLETHAERGHDTTSTSSISRHAQTTWPRSEVRQAQTTILRNAREARTTWPRYDQHQQHQPTRPDNVATIRPASAASADTPRPASAASEEACFSFGRLNSHLPKRTEIWPKTSPFGNGVFSSSRWGIAEKAHEFGPPPPPPPTAPPPDNPNLTL